MVFIDDVTVATEKLASRVGLTVAEVEHDPFNTGDAMVTLTSSELDIRFVLKRGQSWCDVRSPGTQWFFLNDVAEILGIGRVPTNLDMVSTIRAATPLIVANAGRIRGAFGGPNREETLARLQAISDQRVQTLFKRR